MLSNKFLPRDDSENCKIFMSRGANLCTKTIFSVQATLLTRTLSFIVLCKLFLFIFVQFRGLEVGGETYCMYVCTVSLYRDKYMRATVVQLQMILYNTV